MLIFLFFYRAQSFYFATNKIFQLLIAYVCTELKLLNNFSNPVRLLIKELLIKNIYVYTPPHLTLKGLSTWPPTTILGNTFLSTVPGR